MGYLVPPARFASGSPTSWMCPEHLQGKEPRGNPNHIPEPSLRLDSDLPPGEEAHFDRLFPWFCSFGHYPKLMGWKIKSFQFPLNHNIRYRVRNTVDSSPTRWLHLTRLWTKLTWTPSLPSPEREHSTIYTAYNSPCYIFCQLFFIL